MLPQRFWDKVDKISSDKGCWLWTGQTKHGYGLFYLDGKKEKFGESRPSIKERNRQRE